MVNVSAGSPFHHPSPQCKPLASLLNIVASVTSCLLPSLPHAQSSYVECVVIYFLLLFHSLLKTLALMTSFENQRWVN